MPVGSRSKKLFKLREIPYLKLFVIAFVWSTTTILLPVIHTERDLNNVDVILMLFERFLFVLAITIPFDIRDLNVDKSVGLKTIPIRIGERRSWLISYACLTMFAVVSYLHYYMQSNQFVIYALGVSTLMTFYFLMSKRWKKTRWYFYGILDGMMLLQGALVILFWSIY